MSGMQDQFEAKLKATLEGAAQYRNVVDSMKEFFNRLARSTASVSSELLSGLDFGCLSPYFEHQRNPFAAPYARAKQCSAGRST
jgi:hypothetical protein